MTENYRMRVMEEGSSERDSPVSPLARGQQGPVRRRMRQNGNYRASIMEGGFLPPTQAKGGEKRKARSGECLKKARRARVYDFFFARSLLQISGGGCTTMVMRVLGTLPWMNCRAGLSHSKGRSGCPIPHNSFPKSSTFWVAQDVGV